MPLRTNTTSGNHPELISSSIGREALVIELFGPFTALTLLVLPLSRALSHRCWLRVIETIVHDFFSKSASKREPEARYVWKSSN